MAADQNSPEAFALAIDELDQLVAETQNPMAPELKKRSPKAIAGLVQKGEKARKAKNWPLAARYLNEAWAYEPENLTIAKALGEVMASMGARSKAIDLFFYCLKKDPSDGAVAAMAGQLALDMEMFDHADKLNDIYTQIAPLDSLGYVNRATALRKLDRFDEAVDMLQQVLPLIPDSSDLWNVLGSVVNMRDDLDTAMPFYEEAIRLDPKAWKTMNNIARALNDLGRYEEAVPYAKDGCLHSGNDPIVGFGLAMAQLGAGHLPDAWESYEHRLDLQRQDAIRYHIESPYLGGQDFKDKKIMVVAEQGVGDEILFCSALQELIDEAEEVHVGCDVRLAPLFKRSFPGLKGVYPYVDKWLEGYRFRVFPELEDNGRHLDGYIPMAGLFQTYRKTVEDFAKTPKGYLKPDPEKVAECGSYLEEHAPGLKVGICWRSGMLKAERNFWYTQIAQWGPILQTKGVTFVNLQYGDCAEELAEFEKRFGIKVVEYPDLDLRLDLDESAALTQALDLVISIGAQPAMSAFAVDQEVFWLFPFSPWWRFNTDTDTPPMHEKSTLFLCETPMEWDSAMNNAAKALAEKVAQTK